MDRIHSRPLTRAALALACGLLALTLFASPAAAGTAGPELLLSEIVVTPTAGELISIRNVGDRYYDLSDVYLTDATNSSNKYYNIVTGSNAGGGSSSDFHARFPEGATIAPGETQTIAIAGSFDFFSEYGTLPTYELYEDGGSPDAVPDMREAFPGSINGQGGITNGGEVIILYFWDGESDLVEDIDYVVWGDKVEAVDKTGISIDGPDADGVTSTYDDDTAIASQEALAAGHAVGDSFQRVDFTEGNETFFGGNGVEGHDETSENLSVTWTEAAVLAETSALGPARLLLSEIIVTPTESEYVEIFNPNDVAVDLSDVYLTDATFAGSPSAYYYNLPTGSNAGGGGFGDFNARFPDGASIGPGEYQTVSLPGSDDFFATFGTSPTYELFEDGVSADGVPDMREATPGSINGQGGLTNGGEVVVLYHWNGSSDLVGDLDYALWGDTAEAVDKSGVSIDGPDADSDPTLYQNDTALGAQDLIQASGHLSGESFVRTDPTEGTETDTGSNGVDGDDETSENLSSTWEIGTPTPGAGFLGDLTLSIDDVTLPEGDSGTTDFVFTVSITQPAPMGGVTFDIATSDGTATTSNFDYDANSVMGATIPEGETTYQFTVVVNGDTFTEPAETFTVSVTNVSPMSVTVADGTGVGTIENDEAIEIFTIQGSGATSPSEGQVVTTRNNVVTAVGPDGFTMQTPTLRSDGNPETSDGIFVFTGSAPAVAVGDLVDVTGEVVEFFDFTEITGNPSVFVTGTDTLPAPIGLDANFPSPSPMFPGCAAGQLECVESMRVTIALGTTTAGNLSFASDPTAEVPIVAKGVKAFREPGVDFPGLGGSIPVYDGNPEVFEMDADRLGLPFDLISGDTQFSGEGVIGFEFGDYEFWPTSLALSPVSQPQPATPVRAVAANEITVGTLNMFRLFDDVDDPNNNDGNEGSTTTEEYECRRDKLVAYIDQALRLPDILGVQEVENLNALQGIADELSAQTGETWTAELIEGNDIGGIDVGYLVRDTMTTDDVTQLGANETFSCDGSSLHDRPPLLIEATVDSTGLELAVLVVHMRSRSSIDNSGDTCDANPSVQRVRQKRLEQAQSVGQMVENFQTSNPNVPLIVTGDFNAFEFTDGYVDVVGQITGSVEPSENQLSATPIPTPGLTNYVFEEEPEERYSFVFQGSAQVLDHTLATSAAFGLVTDFEFGRGNADAPRVLLDSCDALNAPLELPLRSSDHDGAVLYLLADPAELLFADNFESGDLSAWDVSTEP